MKKEVMTTGTKKYDVIVIGGGAGTKLVQPVAKLGKKVAVIEKDRMGGTCLNWGCIPSKILIHSAEILQVLKTAENHHVRIPCEPEVFFSRLVSEVETTTNQESDQIPSQYAKNPHIDFYHENAKFVAENEIQVGKEILSAEKIFLAVGTRPFIPDIKGLKDTPFITSKEALKKSSQPKNLIIIGGGYVACELGFFYQLLGTQTHLFVRSSLVRNEDTDIQREFTQAFSKILNIHFQVEICSVEYKDKMFILHYRQEGKDKQMTADTLLVATGISPWTDSLGLEKTSVQTDEKGFIQVDKYLKTSAKNIWAFGDCIGKYFFRHTANYEGEYLFKTLFQQTEKKPIEYPPVPHAIFTYPAIGGVGATEQELIKRKVDYVVGINHYKNSARGMALKSDFGLVKLIFERKTKKLIGGHCVGESAPDLTHMIIAYMKMKATLDDLLDTIYIHPALSEVIRNAARKAQEEMKKPCSEKIVEKTD